MQIKVKKYQLDLDITLHNYNRRIPLPYILKDVKIADLIQEKDMLSIIFKLEEQSEEKKDISREIEKRKQEREAGKEKRKARIARFRKGKNGGAI
jgi:hypothetical protein